MSTKDIATKLINYCRKADFETAQSELYADNAISIEPDNSPWPSVEGIANLNAKVRQWDEMVKEIHESSVSDPIIAEPFFSVRMVFDLTMQDGTRNRGEQIAVYEVADDKIVREHFFYRM